MLTQTIGIALFSTDYHWLANSNFPAQFTVKNGLCFSGIFH
jgi:hypothetical protein